MPSENRPASREQAPDPANSYERAKPEREGGLDRPETDNATPADQKDQQEHDPAGRGARHLGRDDGSSDSGPRPDPTPKAP